MSGAHNEIGHAQAVRLACADEMPRERLLDELLAGSLWRKREWRCDVG